MLEGGCDVVVVGGVEVAVDGSTADVVVVETARVVVVLAVVVLDGDTTEEAVEEVAVGTVVLAVTATVLRVSVLPSLSPPAEHAEAASTTATSTATALTTARLFPKIFILSFLQIRFYLARKAARPGRSPCCRSSREAPPPVEMWSKSEFVALRSVVV